MNPSVLRTTADNAKDTDISNLIHNVQACCQLAASVALVPVSKSFCKVIGVAESVRQAISGTHATDLASLFTVPCREQHP
jgi:cytochrome c oxidase assembly protein Cox11